MEIYTECPGDNLLGELAAVYMTWFGISWGEGGRRQEDGKTLTLPEYITQVALGNPYFVEQLSLSDESKQKLIRSEIAGTDYHVLKTIVQAMGALQPDELTDVIENTAWTYGSLPFYNFNEVVDRFRRDLTPTSHQTPIASFILNTRNEIVCFSTGNVMKDYRKIPLLIKDAEFLQEVSDPLRKTRRIFSSWKDKGLLERMILYENEATNTSSSSVRTVEEIASIVPIDSFNTQAQCLLTNEQRQQLSKISDKRMVWPVNLYGLQKTALDLGCRLATCMTSDSQDYYASLVKLGLLEAEGYLGPDGEHNNLKWVLVDNESSVRGLETLLWR
jgi:hypothetical protein